MDEDERQRQRSRTKHKDLIAFWIFGLCNNYGYVVMLTAAEDILSSYKIPSLPNERNCTLISTGIILLADIIPAFIIKSLSPFLPYHTTVRIFLACFTSAMGFIIAANASTKMLVIIGVILTSFSSGLGEPTFLYHSTFYSKDTISTWSSGTGAAGIAGSLSYSILRQIGLSSYNTLLIMIIVPIVEWIVYKTLLSSPRSFSSLTESSIIDTNDNENAPLLNTRNNVPNTILSFTEKLAIIPSLLVYIIPLILVYFFEYFINQGLFELVIFKDIFLTKEQQYHWYQVTYQIGVFVARSSVNIIQIRHTWIMAIIQGILALFFMTEAIYLYVPNIWMIFVIIFIEGLQGGLAYVNTYYRMSQEVMPEYKTYAMNIVSLSDCLGILFAGFFAIYAHNWICNLPLSSNI